MMAMLAKALITFVSNVVNLLVQALPQSPFSAIVDNPMAHEWGQIIGYFFPVSQIISHTQTFLVAVGVWISLRWVFRIVKAVG